MDTEVGLGNTLNRLTQQAMALLFGQAELAQLTHYAFDFTAGQIRGSELEEYELAYPVGYRPSRQTVPSKRKYSKEELFEKYEVLAYNQLPLNFIYHMTTIMEASFNDIVRSVVLEYPAKVGASRQVPAEQVLKSSSIDEIHARIADSVVTSLSYKSPKDYAEELKKLLSITSPLECAAYHSYMEMKATRDIYIHASGVANDVYLEKAGSHARVKSGEILPLDQVYYLECYEACLQVVEWLEKELHQVWHSSEYVERKRPVTGALKQAFESAAAGELPAASDESDVS